MAAKNLLITGANTGLGYETIKILLASNATYDIILGGRSLEKAQAAVATLQKEHASTKSKLSAIQVDVSDDSSITRAFETVKSTYNHIDILVNNAGTSLDLYAANGQMSMRDAWTKAYDTNVTGAWMMTFTFMPLLLKSSDPRLLFLASGTSSLIEAAGGATFSAGEVPGGWPKPSNIGFPGYRTSKTGMNMMMLEWKRMLKNDNVKLWAVSPGFLATNLSAGNPEMLKKMGAGDPVDGAKHVVDVVEGKHDAEVGQVVARTGIQPW